VRECSEPDRLDSNVTRQFGRWYGLRLTLNVHADDYVGMLAQSVGASIVVHNVDVRPTPETSPVFVAPGEACTKRSLYENIHLNPASANHDWHQTR
jgi:hypothetical protein